MTFFTWLKSLITAIRRIGYHDSLDEYERRKLGIFNLLNFTALISGILLPIVGLIDRHQLPALAWMVACSPAMISMLVLYCNYRRRFELGRMIYFSLYPVMTSLVYAARIDVGIELFFLKRIVNVILAFALSISCYLAVFVIWNDYDFRLIEASYAFYFLNHLLAAVCIFLGLYLIKKENARYQEGILSKNVQLNAQNAAIEAQRKEIADKAALLEKQTQELKELDALKNKLFSVISHDLKTPIYALRNLFRNVEQYNLPAEELKMMVPDVVKDLNYTTGLMENLLQWAKSQMQSNAVHPQLLDLQELIREVAALLRLQAESKKVYLELKAENPVYVFADKDMINLVLRNLLSNAIKFTPENGRVCLGAQSGQEFVEVFVEDTGMGMSPEALEKINGRQFYTTKGTANESGTGLGLMLCKEFLTKNGGKMFVESEPGKGSVFSFVLPQAS
jgi:signal transduction histidine kinase